MKIYDLSLCLSAKVPVWPGQPKPVLKIKIKNKKEKFLLTQISLTSRQTTYLSAPNFAFKSGATVDKLAGEKIIGNAKVVDLTGFFKTGGPAQIGWAHFEQVKVRKGDRLLLKTGNYKMLKAKKIRSDYISLSLDAAKNLIKRQVNLIGIDYFNIDKWEDFNQPVKNLLLKNGVLVVEGLNLEPVPAGDYLLVCAPLKIEKAPAAPSRIFLLKQ